MERLFEVQSLYSMSIDSQKLMEYLSTLAAVIKNQDLLLKQHTDRLDHAAKSLQSFKERSAEENSKSFQKVQFSICGLKELVEKETKALRQSISQGKGQTQSIIKTFKSSLFQQLNFQGLKASLKHSVEENVEGLRGMLKQQQADVKNSVTQFRKEFEQYVKKSDSERNTILELLYKDRMKTELNSQSQKRENLYNIEVQELIQSGSDLSTNRKYNNRDNLQRSSYFSNKGQSKGSFTNGDDQTKENSKTRERASQNKSTNRKEKPSEMSSSLLVAMVMSRMSSLEQRLKVIQDELKSTKSKDIVMYASGNLESTTNIANNNSFLGGGINLKKMSSYGPTSSVVQQHDLKDLYKRYEEVRDKLEVVNQKTLFIEDIAKGLKKQFNESFSKMEKKHRQITEMVPRRYEQASQIRTLVHSEMRRLLKELTPKIQAKADTIWCTKQQEKTVKRFQELDTVMQQKCNKQEIKKALVFLENKIKQIILIMSQRQRQDKQGLLVAKPLTKCLSCQRQILDKNTSSNTVTPEHSNWSGMPSKLLIPEKMGKYAMGITHTWRKKLKNSYKNSREVTEREICLD